MALRIKSLTGFRGAKGEMGAWLVPGLGQSSFW